MSSKFDHNVSCDDNGYHPEYKHLVMFEIEPHYGSYILTAIGHSGNCLISSDDAKYMFEDQFELEFAYLSDEYLSLLSKWNITNMIEINQLYVTIENEPRKIVKIENNNVTIAAEFEFTISKFQAEAMVKIGFWKKIFPLND